MGLLLTFIVIVFAISVFLFPFKDGAYMEQFWNFLGRLITWTWQLFWAVLQWLFKLIPMLFQQLFKLITFLFHVRKKRQRPF